VEERIFYFFKTKIIIFIFYFNSSKKKKHFEEKIQGIFVKTHHPHFLPVFPPIFPPNLGGLTSVGPSGINNFSSF
jgi:hypothetical protein